ncbi:hypothetical protein BJX70DRAFT_410909 [Aspergillus crustosus]
MSHSRTSSDIERPVSRHGLPDPTKQSHSRPAEHSIWQKISDWFLWEISATALSAGVLIALVAILIQYNEQPQPSWGYMSLNSLISWLTTIVKGCIIVSCSEALGQLKWVWFSQKAQPIQELRTFDAASRGAYGAVELIWRLRARHFAVFGTLAVTLALAIDPFAQNLVRYYQGLVVDSSQSALIGKALAYDSVGPGVDQDMKYAIYSSFLSSDRQGPWSLPQYSCPSGNCTWGPIVSLEARALCADITSHIIRNCSEVPDTPQYLNRGLVGETNCTLTIPGSELRGYYIPISETAWLEWRGFLVQPTNAPNALVYKNATAAVWQYLTPTMEIGTRRIPPNTTWAATECSIEPIIRSFRPTVRQTEYSDETLDVWIKYENRTTPSSAYNFKPPWGPERGLQPNQTFEYSFLSHVALVQFLQTILSGYLGQSSTAAAYTADQPFAENYASRDILQAFGQGNIHGCDAEPVGRLSCSMQNVAKAISKSFRDSGYTSDNVNDTTMATGRVMANATYIAVRWQWLVLPIFVWALAVTTLAGTIWKMQRGGVPKWRNDPVPLLFLLRDTILDDPGRGMSVRGDEGDISRVKVRLYEDDGRAVLA